MLTPTQFCSSAQPLRLQAFRTSDQELLSVNQEPGTQFALLFIHNATAETLANHPELASRDTAVQAIFSIPEANFKGKDSHKIIELQGMAAIGAGNYALAYLTIESHSGKDYDDVTFQITETR